MGNVWNELIDFVGFARKKVKIHYIHENGRIETLWLKKEKGKSKLRKKDITGVEVELDLSIVPMHDFYSNKQTYLVLGTNNRAIDLLGETGYVTTSAEEEIMRSMDFELGRKFERKFEDKKFDWKQNTVLLVALGVLVVNAALTWNVLNTLGGG